MVEKPQLFNRKVVMTEHFQVRPFPLIVDKASQVWYIKK
jgi:hypothetical protein